MPKFNVIITRDITESACITVEAVNADTAEDAALKHLDLQPDLKWEIDEGSWDIDAHWPGLGSPYVTDVSET